MKVGIVGRKDDPDAASLAGVIRDRLEAEGVDVLLDRSLARDLDGRGTDIGGMAACDLVVSVGGDGTFLYAANRAGTTPVLGVNLGEVGFLNGVSPDDAEEAVAEEVGRIRETGSPRTRAVPRLRAAGDGWELPPAINEVVVMGNQRGHGNGIGVAVSVDGEHYTGGHADGVLVSTPTGSTAYNLSEGGPLLLPSLSGLVVTQMCAADPLPPLVVPLESEVAIRVGDAPGAVVIGDGRTKESVNPPETVRLSRASDPARVAGPAVDFFAALDKLD